MLKKIIVSFLVSIVAILVLGWYINTNYVSEEEERIIQTLYFKLLSAPSKKAAIDKTILVNTAREIALLDDPRDYGKVDITDREKLVQLFHAINASNAKPRLIICDVFFDLPTDQDSALQSEFNHLPQLVIPYYFSDEKEFLPVFNARKGLASYYSHAEKMVKMQLISNDGHKTVPVIADEYVNKRHYEKRAGLVFCDNKLALNSIIPSFYIRPHIIRDMSGVHDVAAEVPLYNIHDLAIAAMDTLQFKNYFDNKIVVIGNFGNRDLHLTPLGRIPGVLVLLNTFLSLDYNEHLVRLGWIIFMLISFALMSYAIIYLRLPNFHVAGKGILAFILNSVFARFITISSAVFVISSISYLWYHIHVNILFVAALYTILADYLKFHRDGKVH